MIHWTSICVWTDQRVQELCPFLNFFNLSTINITYGKVGDKGIKWHIAVDCYIGNSSNHYTILYICPCLNFRSPNGSSSYQVHIYMQ